VTFENKYTPEARKKAVEQMLGGVKERLRKARLKVTIKPGGVEVDDLVIANSEAPAPLETIHFNADPFPEMPERLGECPEKLEPNPLNLTARESLERQISDLMDKVNQALKERNFLIKDALNILEFARTTAYTHPMGEVSVNLFEGARRLSEVEPQFSNTVNRLANLAMEIKQSEQIRG
jgi:hypothetical protein